MSKFGKFLFLSTNLAPLFFVYAVLGFFQKNTISISTYFGNICLSYIYLLLSAILSILFLYMINHVKLKSGTRGLILNSASDTECKVMQMIKNYVVPVLGVTFMHIPLLKSILEPFSKNPSDMAMFCFSAIFFLINFIRTSSGAINSNLLFPIFRYHIYETTNTDSVRMIFITKNRIKNTMFPKKSVCLFDNIYLEKS